MQKIVTKYFLKISPKKPKKSLKFKDLGVECFFLAQLYFTFKDPLGTNCNIREAKLRVSLTLFENKKSHSSNVCTYFGDVVTEIASFASKTSPSGIRTRASMQHSPQAKLRVSCSAFSLRKTKASSYCYSLRLWCTFRDSNPGPTD